MKKSKIVIALLLVFAVVIGLFAGCGHKKAEPEVGMWHAEIQLSDISGSMSDEDKAFMAMMAGSTMFEIDAQFSEDGTFTYVMNTDKLQEAVSNTVSTIFGFFIKFDISLFIDRIVDAALQDALKSSQQNYAGTYTKSDSGLITATDGQTLYFKVNGSSLVQIDEDGNEVLRFTKVVQAEE